MGGFSLRGPPCVKCRSDSEPALPRPQRWKLIHAPRTGTRWGQGSRLGRDFSPPYLFDLRSDPGERRNRIGEGGLEAAWLRSRLRAWVETHRAVEAGEEASPDPEVTRRLRALGYVG